MSAAVTALQTAFHGVLTAALGGIAVHDHVPADATFPYVTFGAATSREVGGVALRLEEHTLFVFVWSKADSRLEAAGTAETVRQALEEGALTIAGHVDVSRIVEQIEITRNAALGLYRAEIRLRAVTHPIS